MPQYFSAIVAKVGMRTLDGFASTTHKERESCGWKLKKMRPMEMMIFCSPVRERMGAEESHPQLLPFPKPIGYVQQTLAIYEATHYRWLEQAIQVASGGT